VTKAQLPNALSLQQVLIQVGQVAGPSVGGLVIARFGLTWAYWIDVITFGAAFAAVWAMSPQPPDEGAARPGLAAVAEGFRYLRGKPVLLSTFAVDLNAMVFGMPRALFPALATDVFRTGPSGLGLLYAAPAAGALVAAVLTGWVGRCGARAWL
jgi:MFS family permease